MDSADAIRNFGALEAFEDYETGFGNIICQTEAPYMHPDRAHAIPVMAL
ncbi:conserved hypothetical protein [Olsenella uli DSM 7084]|uniref:Uncharacterized protein n=1 Tax=Olsenella uli (strain ATCC 49627 / DSM 7084 / CCUG 31166 / CIP 109912 / JCM 12494 / LMG 11480 / NCIMB 702895 / VPI D76D-27C) TaxID=633147 RepID=E1QZD9_OLSUV|nr:conserved hypothetical protein [Olsenella uli DSM 7084]